MDPDWRIVRDVEPRSRRITLESEEESLSAPGCNDATRNLFGDRNPHGDGDGEGLHPVLEADVAHVIAHEEADNEGGHKDDNEIEEDSNDNEGDGLHVEDSELPAGAENVIDDYY